MSDSYWDSDWIPEHRRGISDSDWADRQPKNIVPLERGDVVAFVEGGFGVITVVRQEEGGWPAAYATERIDGLPDHPTTKRAWHYPLDIANVVALSAERTVRELISAGHESTADNR